MEICSSILVQAKYVNSLVDMSKPEAYFNDLYEKMIRDGDDPYLSNAVLDVLGTISAQCKKIEKTIKIHNIFAHSSH